MWKRLRQEQQRGAQLHAREGRVRQPGEAPAEAIEDRDAQLHDEADQQVAPGGAEPPVYPAGRLEDETGDNTPTLPEPKTAWDGAVQPQGRKDADPLPEGK